MVIAVVGRFGFTNKFQMRKFSKHLVLMVSGYSSNAKEVPQLEIEAENFKPLNLRPGRSQFGSKLPPRKPQIFEPRTQQMPIDQDWGSVWPGPRTFHPASVPLPVRQGYVEKKGSIPSKFGNAELMKIPNFLHLTPPVIKRQCEALKKFCTAWPEALNNKDKCEDHFPLEVAFSSYCHSSPSIRDPASRIVTVKLKLASLGLDHHARDKFLRLVGERYDEKTDILTIVTDRCPTRKQNYEYAMYLLTALYHESWNVEEWEKLKSEADMEYYDWNTSKSKQNIEQMFEQKSESIHNYSKTVDQLMNDGENEYNLSKYGDSVRKMLQMPEAL